nr:MAG TPA: Hsc70-interacting protein [Bacteriophage sp.]
MLLSKRKIDLKDFLSSLGATIKKTHFERLSFFVRCHN